MNQFEYDKIKYKYKLNYDGSIEEPNVYLCNRKLKKISQIAPVLNLKVVKNFQDVDECSFTLHKYFDGTMLPNWDKIKDTAVILVEGIGFFEICSPIEETDVIVKNITSKALQPVELGQCNCTLQINTEDDIARTDYDAKYPTLFYRDDSHEEASLLHRILTYAPHYSIGHVDESLKNLNREFSCTDTPVYSFLQTIAEEIGCIFLFDPFSRTIHAFDLEEHCLTCGGRHIIDGVCQSCSGTKIEPGYGLDTNIYIDSENLASQITLTGDKDSMKNCLKIIGGDDYITNMIGQRLIGNTNLLIQFSQEQLEEMTPELSEKYLQYNDVVKSYQEEFNTLWNRKNALIDDMEMWKHNKFPSVEDETAVTPFEVFQNITDTIEYACIGQQTTTLDTLSKQILNYAKLIIPSGYDVRFQTDANGQSKTSCTKKTINHIDTIQTWTGYLYVYRKNCTDEKGKDKYFYQSSAWTLPVVQGYRSNPTGTTYDNAYYLYLKQQIDKELARLNVTDKPKYDTDYTDSVANHLSDKNYYKNYFREFSISQLQSWYDAYSKCSTILYNQNSQLTNVNKNYYYLIDSNGTISTQTIYDALIQKYNGFASYISDIIQEYTNYVEKDEESLTVINKQITEINTVCNLHEYLGEDLYQELMSFRREEVYQNSHFLSDGLDDAQLLQRIEELITNAKQELDKKCHISYSLSSTLGNLLSMVEFKDVYQDFALGNYIQMRVDGKLVKLRLISITYDFTSIENLDVTFSEALLVNSSKAKFQNLMSKASSMATSFDYIQRQTTSNDKQLNTFDKLFSDGLDATNLMIKNSSDVSTVFDSQGLLSRQYDYDSDSYSPCQLRITNSTIAMTENNWQTIVSAFGKLCWNGKWYYGANAELLVGRQIIGKSMEIINDSGTYTMNDDGFLIKNGTNKIELNAETSSFLIEKDGTQKLNYSPETGLYIDGNGKFSGSISVINGAKYIKLDPANPSMVLFNGKEKVFDFDGNNLKLGSSVTLSWGQITGTDNVANKGDIPSDSQITTISKNAISTASISANQITTGTMSLSRLNGASGTLTVNTGNLVINSKNLTLDQSGNATFSGTLSAATGTFSGTITASSGTIGNWNISSGGLYNNSANYLTAIGNSSSYMKDGLYYQTTINNGKIICGLSSGSYAVPYTGASYVDISPAGIYCCSSNHSSTGTYLFAVDANEGYVFMRNNIYLRTTSASGYRTPLIGLSNSNNIWLGDYNKGFIADNCYISANNVYKTTSGSNVDLSDQRYKKEIADIDGAIEFIRNLKPQKYKFTDGTSGRTHFGFLAQNVEDALKKTTGDAGVIVKYTIQDDGIVDLEDDSTYVCGLRYEELIAPIVSSIQDLYNKIDTLTNNT